MDDRLKKMAAWVQKFKDVGSPIAQYDPTHAALPWAGIFLVLQIVTSDAQTLGAMGDGLEKVAQIIARYASIEVFPW